MKLKQFFGLVTLLILANTTFKISAQTSIQNPDSLTERPFLKPEQVNQVFQELIQFIETYDAEGIETRSRTKTVEWPAYKQRQHKQFLNSKNWQQLRSAFDQLTAGFVNLHSRFKFNLNSDALNSSIKLGFTYPNISFFNRDNKQTITAVNEQPITAAFHDFEQFGCAFNSKIGCLHSFVSHFNRGMLLVENQPVKSVKQANQTITLEYSKPEKAPQSSHSLAIEVDQYVGWELLAQGHNIALFKQPGLLLLKIKSFRYAQGSGADFRCAEEAEKESMCADIQLIRKIFNQTNTHTKNLIIDVQNNGGGNENTAFIAELSQAPFQDLIVRFKNTALLADEQLRQGLFYGSNRAEDWYQQLTVAEKSLDNEWLPVRADFCRADKSCQLSWIQPNSKRQFKGIYILTNEYCVSSCDDLVWRLNEFSHALVVGMPQAADATYSRISATFYLDSENKIQHQIHTDGAAASFKGTALFTATIPYSQGVQANGQMRQGNPAETKFLLPITAENFASYEFDSLNYLAIKIRAGEL